MNSRLYKILAYLSLILLVVTACNTQPKKSNSTKKPNTSKLVSTNKPSTTKPVVTIPPKEDVLKVNLPEIKREFRAVWVASVANINWPSRKDLTTNQQKAEAIQILETLQNNNFNAVVLQIRPSADALYKSDLEPWSFYLTGEIGKAPNPFYDPLQFWIDEAHQRGIELHVWLNPYRAHHTGGGNVTSNSMVRKSPENVVKLRNGMYWFDPSNVKTQDHVSNVVKDVLKRYDVDGIHFDDYFYPYASYNGGRDFPDNETWSQYQKAGGKLSRADWRRDNVNKFVERIYKEIKAEKNDVKFGISPFGIWKPGYPAGITGSSQYDELYADAKLWLNKGWVDYFSPQLYWPIDSKGQSFPALLQWWKSENTHKRHLWPGLNTVEVKVADRAKEISNQVKLTRDIIGKNAGEIHYSMAGLTKNATMLPTLKNVNYQEKALMPLTPWLKTKASEKPKLNLSIIDQNAIARWESSNLENVFQWVIFTQYGNDWEYQILTKSNLNQQLPLVKNGKKLNVIALKSIDKLGNESDYHAKKVQ